MFWLSPSLSKVFFKIVKIRYLANYVSSDYIPFSIFELLDEIKIF